MRLAIEKMVLTKTSGSSYEVSEKKFQEFANGPVIVCLLLRTAFT